LKRFSNKHKAELFQTDTSLNAMIVLTMVTAIMLAFMAKDGRYQIKFSISLPSCLKVLSYQTLSTVLQPTALLKIEVLT
jgi:hypothetical protein